MAYLDGVAPLAGAWIEISLCGRNSMRPIVAPLAGAWIEILSARGFTMALESPPSRGRGLKFSLVGTAIIDTCRPPRGGVG